VGKKVVVFVVLALVLVAPVAAQDNPDANEIESWLAPVGTNIGIYMGLGAAALFGLMALPWGFRIGLRFAAGAAKEVQRIFSS
jgi:hypothetical protein